MSNHSEKQDSSNTSKQTIELVSDAPAASTVVDKRKLLWKLDRHLLPFFCIMYLLAFLDRSAIGNARLYGLELDLHMTDEQYLLALTVFFFSYSLIEPLSNLALKFIRPSIWLSLLFFIWGICVVLQGVVHDYGGLVTLRVLLGIFEAGFFPGAVFCLSCWYKRSQLGLRIAMLSSSQTFSGAFGGLLAAAISKMDGVGGRPAWAWIFILEGLITILVSLVSFRILDDYPQDSKFLTPSERAFLLESLKNDGQIFVRDEQFHIKRVWAAFSDYKTWIGLLLFAGFDGPLYAFSLFTPSIINQLGFHANIANLLSVPVYAVACVTTCLLGYYADRTPNIRGYINLCAIGTGIIAYIILAISRNAALSYFAVYLAACAIYPTIPNSIAWMSANLEGPIKKSLTVAMCIGFGNLNGAVTSNVYRSNQTPWYSLGHEIILTYLSIAFVSTLAYREACRRENIKREKGLRDEVIVGQVGGIEENGVFNSIEDAKMEKGDSWSQFRYSL